MNHLRHLAANQPAAFNQVRKSFQKECREFPIDEFVALPNDQLSKFKQNEKSPAAAWRNRHFLAAIYMDYYDGIPYARLSVNRTELNSDGSWKDGITWDELMEIKRGIGFGMAWMTEVFPPDAETVNVANIRHLFIVNQPPFAWVRKSPEMPKRNPMLKGFWKTITGGFRKL